MTSGSNTESQKCFASVELQNNVFAPKKVAYMLLMVNSSETNRLKPVESVISSMGV